MLLLTRTNRNATPAEVCRKLSRWNSIMNPRQSATVLVTAHNALSEPLDNAEPRDEVFYFTTRDSGSRIWTGLSRKHQKGGPWIEAVCDKNGMPVLYRIDVALSRAWDLESDAQVHRPQILVLDPSGDGKAVLYE